ncbi:MAG: hypothetical protein HKL92_07635 [Candidatus Eremiobacteraeota bacterium]|nr:hypothetical protein [Candidatus Eremiobacteraeota bacterium]NNM93197.1 hypothetical protein [Candidatus Eremiobacteraeota bacterium]
MSCTSTTPDLTAHDRALQVEAAIPPGLFRVENEQDRIAWRVAPEPFGLSEEQLSQIERIGNDLLRFYKALNTLYTRSVRGTAPAFIAEYLDLGKPEHILRLSRQNRFKNDIPAVIRPDLLITESGFIASELDSVPGGMGFVGAMAHAYCSVGSESVGGRDGMARGFAEIFAAQTGKEHPSVAVVVSEESEDYRAEMSWLAADIARLGIADIAVVRPEQILFTEEALFVREEGGGEHRIDALYRNFELFDLLNVPKQELMLYAARHQRVRMTPPPKAHLEEKLSFALLHHYALQRLWVGELGEELFIRLRTLFPETWILDPRPLPPQAAIVGVTVAGRPVDDFMDLAELTKSEREYVVKPSGFSELAWGSRGVKVANDLTREEWIEALRNGLAQFEKTPHILQRFHKPKRVRQSYLDRRSDEIRTFDGRVRLCPYYFVLGDEVRVGGILATIAPADKRLIHGMTDAVMASCALLPAEAALAR